MAPSTVWADLRGAAQLATAGTLGLAAVVEAVHARITSLPGRRGPEHTHGMTGQVYASVRAVTRLAGGGAGSLLQLLEQLLEQFNTRWAGSPAQPPAVNPTRRDAVLAALNGVLGDHLAATHNPLALPMVLRSPQGAALTLQTPALTAALPQAGPRLLVLLHGLCMNHQQWLREGHDHGAALAQAAGYTPIYLHYNTGLPIFENGAAFALQMQALLQAWPQPLQRVALLGHSMGGLVARSALHQGAQAGQAWVGRVDDAVFLGSPHHGAPLERAGRWLDLLLGAAPYAAPLARLARVRSAGITSLRQGNLLAGTDGSPNIAVPLPVQRRCYAIAGTTGAHTHTLKNRLLGDGLVPVASALGRHADVQRHLPFAAERQATLPHTGHLALLSSPQVAALLLRWLK